MVRERKQKRGERPRYKTLPIDPEKGVERRGKGGARKVHPQPIYHDNNFSSRPRSGDAGVLGMTRRIIRGGVEFLKSSHAPRKFEKSLGKGAMYADWASKGFLAANALGVKQIPFKGVTTLDLAEGAEKYRQELADGKRTIREMRKVGKRGGTLEEVKDVYDSHHLSKKLKLGEVEEHSSAFMQSSYQSHDERKNIFDKKQYEYDPELSNEHIAVATSRRTGQPVIVFRGTNDLPDWRTDVEIFLGVKPEENPRVVASRQAVRAVADKYGRFDIVAMGHSLGGYLAQHSQAQGGIITYNKYSVGDEKYNPRQIDYRNLGDVASTFHNPSTGNDTRILRGDHDPSHIRSTHSDWSTLHKHTWGIWDSDDEAVETPKKEEAHVDDAE